MLSRSKSRALLPRIAAAMCTTHRASWTSVFSVSGSSRVPSITVQSPNQSGRQRPRALRISRRSCASGKVRLSALTAAFPTKPVAPVTAMTGIGSACLIQRLRMRRTVDQFARQNFGLLETVALEKIKPRAAPGELAGRCSGQRVQRYQFDQAGDAELGLDLLLQTLYQAGLTKWILFAALNDQHGDFGTVLGRNRECRSVLGANFGLLLGQVLQILRPDVAAVDDQQVLCTARDEKGIAGPIAHVPGIEPSVVRQGCTGRFRIVGIAGHDARAAQEDCAAMALLENATALVANLDLVIGQRPAAVDEFGNPAGFISSGNRLCSTRAGQNVGVEAIHLETLRQRGEADGQRAFGHAVAGQERGFGEVG